MLIWIMRWAGRVHGKDFLPQHTYCIHTCTEEFQLCYKTNSSLLAALTVTIQCRDSLARDEIALMFPGL